MITYGDAQLPSPLARHSVQAAECLFEGPRAHGRAVHVERFLMSDPFGILSVSAIIPSQPAPSPISTFQRARCPDVDHEDGKLVGLGHMGRAARLPKAAWLRNCYVRHALRDEVRFPLPAPG